MRHPRRGICPPPATRSHPRMLRTRRRRALYTVGPKDMSSGTNPQGMSIICEYGSTLTVHDPLARPASVAVISNLQTQLSIGWPPIS